MNNNIGPIILTSALLATATAGIYMYKTLNGSEVEMPNLLEFGNNIQEENLSDVEENKSESEEDYSKYKPNSKKKTYKTEKTKRNKKRNGNTKRRY
jgi:hypothetical protein